MKAFRLLKQLGIVLTATFWFIAASQWLLPGSFATHTLGDLVVSTLLITTFAYIAFYLVGIGAWIAATFILRSLKIDHAPWMVPGLLLQVLFGTVGGTFAIWLSSLLLPDTVLLHSVLAIFPYALANTVLIWLLALHSGAVRKPIKLLPETSY
ncbi:MAG: hypothetical protein P4L53_23655 [Candidatus Obscuribacterales bacterium]|nr:hypothetical protein [Candidatus Obscuribacterales bacterium]